MKVVILGNSGAARECWWLLRDIFGDCTQVTLKGFLSFEGYPDKLAELAEYSLGIDDAYVPEVDDVFVIGLGSPALRQKAYHKWKDRGLSFPTLVHPSVSIPGSTDIGEANIVTLGCMVSCNSSLGTANFFNRGCIIGHDVHMGEANFLAPRVCLLGECLVGSLNSFGCGSMLLAGGKVGSRNLIAPGATLYLGCRDDCRMAGSPAIKIGDCQAL